MKTIANGFFSFLYHQVEVGGGDKINTERGNQSKKKWGGRKIKKKERTEESKKLMDRQIENNEKIMESLNLCELTSFETVVLTNKQKFSSQN